MAIMTQVYYVCPECDCPTYNMVLSERKTHAPTEDELAQRPGLESLGHEVFVCPCGIEHTWFSVRMVEYD